MGIHQHSDPIYQNLSEMSPKKYSSPSIALIYPDLSLVPGLRRVWTIPIAATAATKAIQFYIPRHRRGS